VAAHYSSSMFDDSENMTLDGTLGELRWVNPHVNLVMLGTAQEGAEPTTWPLETTSPGRMVRVEWIGPA
jgi:Family of unknown function (DUF6152)